MLETLISMTLTAGALLGLRVAYEDGVTVSGTKFGLRLLGLMAIMPFLFGGAITHLDASRKILRRRAVTNNDWLAIAAGYTLAGSTGDLLIRLSRESAQIHAPRTIAEHLTPQTEALFIFLFAVLLLGPIVAGISRSRLRKDTMAAAALILCTATLALLVGPPLQ